LLRVEGVRGLPALALGSDEGLEELANVVAVGFPFGTSLRAVSVNPGSITSLRHKDGRLHRIQLDVVLNRGNSGGPVLDSDGKVIGVVESGIVVSGGTTTRGAPIIVAPTQVNFAIPVSLVSRFLARPEVHFDPPRPKPGELHKPMQFEARVTSLLPTAAPLTVDLILKAGNGPERTARMQSEGDRYRANAVPVPGRSGPRTVRLVARFDDGTLDSTTTERSFRIGGREVALGEVRSIHPGSPSRVVLRGGETITGALVGLEAVPIRLGQRTESVNLTGSKAVTITPVGQVERVACTLVVRQGDREIYRQSQSLGTPDMLKMVEVARLQGHSDVVIPVAVTPDGRRLLSGSKDRTMILWDRDAGSVLRRFREQGGWLQSVAISPDGRRALSGGQDSVVRLWDLESGDVIREFRGHTEWVFSVAFSPDGRLAYSTSGGFYPGDVWRDGADSAIRVWDVQNGRQVRRLEGHRGIVWSVAVSPDGRRILSGGHDGAPILWDAETGVEIRRFRGHTGRVTWVAFLPDGRRIVSCGQDSTVRLWDVETGQEIHCFRGHGTDIVCVSVSPDGRWLLSADHTGRELRLWDVEARKQVDQVSLGSDQPVLGCFTPDGHHAVWGSTDGVVRMYRLQPGESGRGETR
jgi:hypothetical protein